LPCSKGI